MVFSFAGVNERALGVGMRWWETHLSREARLECGICFSPQERGFGLQLSSVVLTSAPYPDVFPGLTPRYA